MPRRPAQIKKTNKRKTGGDGEETPDPFANVVAASSLVGDSGSKYIVFDFSKDADPNTSIIADNTALLYMKGGITHGEISIGTANESTAKKVFGFLGRALAGETVLLQEYKGQGVVALGNSIPGDIMMITIDPGQEYFLSRGAFIACTKNVRISGALNFIGIIGFGQEEGMVLPSATVTDNSRGYLWVGSYGTFEKHDIPAGQSMLINNGLFLAATKKYDALAKLGKSIISSLFGEGLGMQFNGPCTVYTQSKNMNQLVMYIYERMPHKNGSSQNGISFTFGSDGGGGRKNDGKTPRKMTTPK